MRKDGITNRFECILLSFVGYQRSIIVLVGILYLAQVRERVSKLFIPKRFPHIPILRLCPHWLLLFGRLFVLPVGVDFPNRLKFSIKRVSEIFLLTVVT
jgi:hypothetical protein